MLIRKSNWQSALSLYVVSAAQTRFVYGGQDCGLFVAGAIREMTGVDVARRLRGSYKTRAQAFDLIQGLTGQLTMGAIAEHLAEEFEVPEVGVLHAQRGDPVMLRHGRRSSLGIVAMHGTEILTPYRSGLLRLPLSHANRAWHI